MHIKICGITNLEDAIAAVDLGADMLGFNFYPGSPRCIQPEMCAEITAQLAQYSPSTILVGVFVNAPVEEIEQVLDGCSLQLAQLSGDEPAATLMALAGCSFKALRPAGAEALAAALKTYPPRLASPRYLIDACAPGQYGGSGVTADWGVAGELARQMPILLAGGLTAENVAAAIAQVHPWGVDVASGVEAAPGRKDQDKMAAFIEAARKFEKENTLCS